MWYARNTILRFTYYFGGFVHKYFFYFFFDLVKRGVLTLVGEVRL